MGSSSSSSSSSSGGIGFCGALAILFIALKLLGYIDWSWWWVLSPLWGGFAIALLIIASVIAVAVVADMREQRIRISRRK